MSNFYQNQTSKFSNLNQGNFSSPKRNNKKFNNFNNTRNNKKCNTFNTNTNRPTQNTFRTNTSVNYNHFETNNHNRLLLRRNNNRIQQHKQNILKQQARLRKENKYSVQAQTRALQTISNNYDKKTQELLKEYEIMHKMPLVLYIFDIMSTIRILNENKNIEILLPCSGSIFDNLWRFKQSKNNLQHYLTQDNIIVKDEIKKVLNYSQNTYIKHFKDPPSPKEIKFKVNGIWETDVQLIRAFNNYLNNLMKIDNDNHDKHNPIFNHPQCEYHLRIWANGLIEKQQINININKFDDEEYGDDSSDDSENDDYANFKPNNNNCNDEPYPNIDDNNIDITEVIRQNKKALNIKSFQRKLLEKNNDNDEKKSHEKYHLKYFTDKSADKDIEIPRFDDDYESIDDFVERVCKTSAEPKLGQAIMILIDAKNDPDINVYVWRKNIKLYNNINIGNARKHYKKQKYFDLKCNENIINVGQYIGMSTCILDGYIHQYWSVFGRDIRFETEHARQLWPYYYENQTLFEVKTDFEEQYAEQDEKKQAQYKEIYGNELIDKLSDVKSKFDSKDIDKIVEESNEKWEKYKNDVRDNDDHDEFDIETYGPMRYHRSQAGTINQLKIDLQTKNDIRKHITGFTPKEYKRVKDHAKANKWSDVPVKYETDDDDEES